MDRFSVDIRDAFEAHAVVHAPCLNTEDLELFYTDRLPADQMDGVRTHLASCETCLDLARDYCVFRGIEAPGSQSVSATTEPTLRASWWSPGLKIAAGILLAVAIGVTWRITGDMTPPGDSNATMRNVESNLEPQAIAPTGKLQQPPQFLEWKPTDSVEHYEVELQDSHFNIVWRKSQIKETRVAIPADLSQTMTDGAYGWRVFAVTRDGRRIGSPFAAFEVAR